MSDFLKRILERLRAGAVRRQAIGELSSLSDAQLADIGLLRAEIATVVDDLQSQTPPAKPTLRLVASQALPAVASSVEPECCAA